MWQLILVLSGTFLFLHFFMAVLYTLSFPLEIKDDSIQDKDPCGNNRQVEGWVPIYLFISLLKITVQ